MGRTALHNSVLLLLLVFAFIYPNCMTSTVSAGFDESPQTYSGGTGWRPCHRGQHCGRHATPTGNSIGTLEPSRPMPSPGPIGGTWPGHPSGNSIGTPEPGRPMPPTGFNGATWPGRPTLRRTRASNPSALLPILVTISIASVLVWSWRRGRRRNSEASQTHLVAVADLGQQTIRFMPVSPRSGTIFPGIQGGSR